MRKFIVFFVLIILFIGCSKTSDTPKPLEKINLQLKWIHQAQFAGNYVAKEKGFYSDEGLDVSLIPFDFKTSVADSLANGNSQFGILGSDELVVARSKGLPLKAVAVIYKINPVTAYTLTNSGIIRPQDFIGKRIGVEKLSDGSDYNVGILYYAMMRKLGINLSNITEVRTGFDDSELINGSVDVSTGYIINEPNLAIEKGYHVHTILMADYGVNIYADCLVTTEDMIENNPETVKKMVAATLKGWQYSIENEIEAVNITMKYATSSSLQHQTKMLAKSIPLILARDGHLGWSDSNEWNRVNDILTEQGVIPAKIDINASYTNEFMPVIE